MNQQTVHHDDGKNITAASTVPTETGLDAFVERANQKRRRKRGFIGWLWFFAIFVLPILMLNSLLESNPPYLLIYSFLLATALHINRQHADLVRIGGAFETYDGFDRNWRDALLEALDWPIRGVRAIARQRLIRFLAHLTASDADLLTRDQRAGLYRNLTPFKAVRHSDLSLAILRVLPHIGDARALPYLERLALLPNIYGLRRIRKAARACLPLLEERLAEPIREQARERAALCMQALAAPNSLPQSASDVSPTTSPSTPFEEMLLHLSATVEATDGAVTSNADIVSKTQSPPAPSKQHETLGDAPGMRIGFLIASWCVFVPYFAVLTWKLAHPFNPFAFLTLFLMIASTQLYRITLLPRHRKLARELARLDDIAEIGRLVEALSWPDREINEVAEAALKRLLPRLHATDAHLLNERHRGILYSKLEPNQVRNHSSFLLALLKALEQVGDGAALPGVRALAKIQPYSKSERAVHDAAEQCLPYLQERAELHQSSRTLLRASASSEEDRLVETLLKPAVGVTEIDQTQLLRAGTDVSA